MNKESRPFHHYEKRPSSQDRSKPYLDVLVLLYHFQLGVPLKQTFILKKVFCVR